MADQAYADIIALIDGSASMEDAERQYWKDMLPTMSTDQQNELRTILQNEKRRRDKVKESALGEDFKAAERARQERWRERRAREQKIQDEDHELAHNLLSKEGAKIWK